MAWDYRTLNRTVLAKVESSSGIDASPVVGTDAVLVENPQTDSGIAALATNEVTGSLDPRAPIPGGGGGTHSGTVNLHGSGTGGTAPEYGPYLRGCALAQTLVAADVSGTMRAGSTASVANLATGDGANVNIGMILTTTGGVGSGQTRVITAISTDDVTVYPDFTVTPDVTTTYDAQACALYVPASTALETLTIYDYFHATPAATNSELRKLLGSAGEGAFTLPNAGIATAAFTFAGKWTSPTNVSRPAAATYQSQRPVMFSNADVSLNGVATKFNQMTFALGNQAQHAPDPSDTFGVDVAGIVRRRISGRINPPLELLSVRDVFADFLAGTTRKLWVRYGAIGNGISFYFPTIAYTGRQTEDVEGFAAEGIPFAATGEDTGVYISIY